MIHLSALLLLTSLYPAPVDSGNWPSFRGPTQDGKASGAHDLPISWSESENIVWKTPIHGKAWSSPVVWGDQIWMTTATEDGKKLGAICVDRRSGKILHDSLVFEIEKPFFCHPVNSYASSTPVIEEGRLYVHYGSAGTGCIDTETGKVLWTRNDFPCNHFRAAGASPILYQNLLVLSFDGFDLQYLVALDKKTGSTVWKKDKAIDFKNKDGDGHKAYSTPRVLTLHGKPTLVSPSAEQTIALDPETGVERWRVTHGGMNASAVPLWGLDRIFLTCGSGNKLLAVKPGSDHSATIDWTLTQNVPSRSSLVMNEDLLFMVNDGGIASCVDARSGKLIKQLRLGGSFYASPVLADGKIYCCNQEKPGKSFVIEATRDMNLLGTGTLDEGCMASPVFLGQSLFLRTRTHLLRIERR